MRYLISGANKGEWMFNAEELLKDLKRTWPDANIKYVGDKSTHFSHSFSLKFNSDLLSGDFHKTQEFIGFEGSIESCVAFAKWIFQVTNAGTNLLVYDQGYNVHVSFNSQTSSEVMHESLTMK